MQSWLFLIGAILLEVAGTTAMKMSEGYTKIIPSILMFIFYILSLIALTYALKKFDVSMAYAIWSGVGTALITIIGVLFFKESFNTIKAISVLFIIFGVIGLHLGNQH
jgi:small multidrug resistance pump